MAKARPAWVQSSMPLKPSPSALDPDHRTLDLSELVASSHQALCLALPLFARGLDGLEALGPQQTLSARPLHIAIVGANNTLLLSPPSTC